MDGWMDGWMDRWMDRWMAFFSSPSPSSTCCLRTLTHPLCQLTISQNKINIAIHRSSRRHHHSSSRHTQSTSHQVTTTSRPSSNRGRWHQWGSTACCWLNRRHKKVFELYLRLVAATELTRQYNAFDCQRKYAQSCRTLCPRRHTCVTCIELFLVGWLVTLWWSPRILDLWLPSS